MATPVTGIRIPSEIAAAIETYRNCEALPDRSEAIVRLLRSGLERAKVRMVKATPKTASRGAGQNASSGREAAKWGSATGPTIGTKLGFTRVSTNSNEFWDTNGHRLSIRCARGDNNQIGLLNDMRDRIDYVIGAFEADDGGFDLYKISAASWTEYARPGSPGSKAGSKLTLLTKTRLVQFGMPIGRVHI